MTEDIIKLSGQENGPSSMILVGTHGHEKCGVVALEKILATLKIERGSVFIAYGNPRAIEKNIRFTEADLNRMFKSDDLLSASDKLSYEYRRAQFLKKYFDQVGVLLDIHASSILNSRPFVICEKIAQGLVEYLPFDLVVSGFDQVEPGGTDYYLNSFGKVGICVECGFLGDLESVRLAEESIWAFLRARGHLLNDLKSKKQSYVRMYELYKTKTNTFILSRPFENFEIVEEDQLIGRDGEEEIRANKQSLILFAHNCDKAGSEAFLLGEKKESLE
ncbi:MAG: succinylglutamate desuccinylase/aspartoacylase family protein [Patescibacteria group bacterium]|jgi:succinylglutamate desuccinylase